MRTVIATTALALLIAHTPIDAQRRQLGRLEGTVAPWIATRALNAAQVSLVSLESETSTTVTARVDATGPYSLDSLPVGRYLVQVSHPTLDSLDVTLPPARLVIAAGKTTRADFSLPSGERLRAIVCPGVSLGPEKAVVAGRVVEAESEAPLIGAKVVAAWTELSVDRKARKVVSQGKHAVVSTGRGGEYRLCGVPVVRSLELQIQHAERAGTVIRVTVSPEEGVAVRDFSLSARSALTIAALDSIDRLAFTRVADSSREADALPKDLALTGDATLTGTVRTASGRPVAGADVRVRYGEPSAVTDDAGRFSLPNLPAGTQMLLVRRFGFALAERPVELRPDRSVDVNVRLTSTVTLDSVRVSATHARLAEFEHNRKTNLLGRFLTLRDIQRSRATKTSDLLPLLGGHVMMGRGRRAKMLETDNDPPGTHSCKDANVVIDGVNGQAVDDVLPNQIAGIELYRDAAAAPLEYAGRAACGVIVIWLRPGPRWQGWRALFGGAPRLE